MAESSPLLLLVSKALGYAIVAGGAGVKLPQIFKVVGKKSAEGLAFSSIELEVIGYSIAVAYNAYLGLSISAAGEIPLILLQDSSGAFKGGVCLELLTAWGTTGAPLPCPALAASRFDWILLALVYWYAKASSARVVTMLAIYGAVLWSYFAGHVTPHMLEVAFTANNFVFAAARIPQIMTNFRERSTGELSLVTSGMNLLGCVVRVLTSIVENASFPVLRSYLIGTTLNSILVGQILYYGSRNKGKKKKA